MAGKQKLSRELRLATKGQLWVLNRSRKLALVDDAEPIGNSEADRAIKRSMAKDAIEEPGADADR